METVKCPYCGEDIEIDHEDGYGYAEDETYSQECNCCGKIFTYHTTITFDYEVKKCDCLNGGEHHWQLSHTFPKSASKMICTTCGEERNLTDEEREEFILQL